MNCPTVDKLSQYVDNLLPGDEVNKIQIHVRSCKECMRVVEAFEAEEQFLKETLQTPALPDNFDTLVLNQLEPYEQKPVSRKRSHWKRMMLAAAVVMLSFGLTATFSPSLAKWVGSFFDSEQVDEGLRMASEEGFSQRVNKEVSDQGLTFKVEDVIADSSRVALSYQVLKGGKSNDSYLDLGQTKNEIYAIDEKGSRLEISSIGWSDTDEYGLIELSLRDYEQLEKLTIKFNLVELDGVKGSWKLDVPVDLKESFKSTKVVALDNATFNEHGVEVNMKEVRFAPSSNEIKYITAFTEEEKLKVEKQIQELESKFGKDVSKTFTGFGTAIQYHLENGDSKPIYYHNAFLEGRGHPSDQGLLQGTSQDMSPLGKVAWNESFIPQKDNEKLTFVLDGMIKTVPSDFSVKIRPKELKTNPVSFEYEGNYMTIKAADMDNEFSLKKSIIPIERETIFKIQIEGGKDATSSELGEWALVDAQGNSYMTLRGASILDEKDKNGRYKTSIELSSYDLKEIPEELTLHLISVTRYDRLKEEWKVPLY